MIATTRQGSAEVLTLHGPDRFFDFFHFANDLAVLFAVAMASAAAAMIGAAACLNLRACRRWIAGIAGIRRRDGQPSDHQNKRGCSHLSISSFYFVADAVTTFVV
jgi:hypothetical protein